MVNITPIIQAFVCLIIAVLVSIVIPYIKANTTAQQQLMLEQLIAMAVSAAEQIYKGTGRGKEKKQFVLDWLHKNGITLDEDVLDAMIESAVYQLTNGGVITGGIGADSPAFVPRLTCPEKGNPYYNTKANGGYSNAIKGSPTNANCDVLSNCVGYAYGRFNEIGGWGYCKYLQPVNAENFIQYAAGLKTGNTPKVGAVIVWQKGATLSNSDGAGHVAIVEKVISPTQIVTSESGWNSSTPFWTKTRNKGDGNWGAGAGYTFLGFIYNPAACCADDAGTDESASVTPAESAKEVDWSGKVTASGLNIRAGAGTDYRVVSGLPRGASVRIVKEDNGWGMLSIGGWVCLDYIQRNGSIASHSKDSGEKMIVTASALNVRSGPGTNYPAVGVLRHGEAVSIVKEDNGWGQLEYGKWVCMDYLAKTSA